MDPMGRLDHGEEDISAIECIAQEDGDAEHTYALLSKQYGALFRKDDSGEEDREVNEPFSDINLPKLKEHEKEKIYKRFGN
mmetsp:Transcript_11772/g.15993  ORF Transcript_11772/g.15993 Transcript_11772/m.15993 type:complete len:81 (+) Transcript_11772:718-960(+)